MYFTLRILWLERLSNAMGGELDQSGGCPMTLSRRQLLGSSCATLAASVSPRFAGAAVYRAKPVRVFLPFAAGGPNGLAPRLIAQGLSDRLGKQFSVYHICRA